MRSITIGLLILLAGLQYKLWIAEDNIIDLWHLKRTLSQHLEKNQQLRERNSALFAEVMELKSGDQALEERARYQLGLVKRGEIYYQIVD